MIIARYEVHIDTYARLDIGRMLRLVAHPRPALLRPGHLRIESCGCVNSSFETLFLRFRSKRVKAASLPILAKSAALASCLIVAVGLAREAMGERPIDALASMTEASTPSFLHLTSFVFLSAERMSAKTSP